jgi:hypothetical protein
LWSNTDDGAGSGLTAKVAKDAKGGMRGRGLPRSCASARAGRKTGPLLLRLNEKDLYAFSIDTFISNSGAACA